MATVVLGDIVTNIKEVVNPKTCGLDKFVGLEHYDAGEPMITRYGTPENLDTNVKHFCKGDILVARRNVYLKRAGYVDFEGVTSGDSIVLRVTNPAYQRILPFILNTDDFWDYAEQNADGTMSKRLSPDDLLDYEFEELEDKDALSQKLWAAYRVKESYRKLLAVTDDMLKAEFLKMFGDGVANPNNWPEVTLSECFPYIKNGVNIKQISGASGIPITRIETLSGSVFNRDRLGYANIHDIAKYEKYVLSTGDLLMSHINSKAYIGRTVEYIKNGEEIIIHGMNLLCLKVDKQKLLPSFYVHYTHSRKYIEDIARIRKDAINQSSINTTDFGNLKIILPPLELQQQFIEIANQAEIAKSSLRKSIESINRVMHNLINQ